MGKKKMEEINASSMADIAFLLLIFFLVTTTMNVDTGLPRLLPPMPQKDQKEQEQDYTKRNVLLVRVNRSDKLLVGGKPMDITQLRDKAKEFLLNPNDDPELAERREKNIPGLGNIMVSKGVISLQNDRATTYAAYLQVQNELMGAYSDLRNALSKQRFGKSYDKLPEDQQKAIQAAYPLRISEAEPVER